MTRTMRQLQVFPITTRTLVVSRVVEVSPGMIRVTLTGPELDAHIADNGHPVAAFRSDGFDDEFKLILKHPDAEVVVGPTQADGQLNWPRGNEHLLFRTYTVRRWDERARELDIDVVVHGLGPATTWARTVTAGDEIQIAGPKMSAGHPAGADWVLIAGDETALPAIVRWLEEWPEGVQAQVFIEIAEDTHRQEIPQPDGVEITWLSRDGAEAGTGAVLFEALQQAPWWGGTPFAWIAGESLTLAPIRRWLRQEKGLEKNQLDVTGYWRRQDVVVSETDATAIDFEATDDDADALHDLGEIVPGFALRVAATIHLADAFDGAEQSVSTLARRTSTDQVALGKVLRYLCAIDVVEERSCDTFALTSVGRGLEDEHLHDHFDLNGYIARRELTSMLNLLDMVVGREPQIPTPGSEHGADDDLLRQRLAAEARDGRYVAGPLAEAIAPAGQSRMLIAGPDAVGIAGEMVSRNTDIAVDVMAPPAEIAVFAELYPVDARITLLPGRLGEAPLRGYDEVVVAELLTTQADADAVQTLATVAASVVPGGRVHVFGETLDRDLASEEDHAEDLVLFGATGGGLRTDAELRHVIATAGLDDVSRRTIGWGYTLFSAQV